MDDLITFINKRLDEDEAAAYALGGTTWTAKRLDDHDYEIHVAYEPLIHAVTPTDGIADVQREDVAGHIARYDPRRAQREIAAKRKHLALYAEVTKPTTLRERAFFPALAEVLAAALRADATVWSDHPDYQPGWTQ